jgi:hypothetical protein
MGGPGLAAHVVSKKGATVLLTLVLCGSWVGPLETLVETMLLLLLLQGVCT